jgi:hypothetical protein
MCIYNQPCSSVLCSQGALSIAANPNFLFGLPYPTRKPPTGGHHPQISRYRLPYPLPYSIPFLSHSYPDLCWLRV